MNKQSQKGKRAVSFIYIYVRKHDLRVRNNEIHTKCLYLSSRSTELQPQVTDSESPQECILSVFNPGSKSDLIYKGRHFYNKNYYCSQYLVSICNLCRYIKKKMGPRLLSCTTLIKIHFITFRTIIQKYCLLSVKQLLILESIRGRRQKFALSRGQQARLRWC